MNRFEFSPGGDPAVFAQQPQLNPENENTQKSCSHHIEALFVHCKINCKKTVTLALAK
jgi:hypothetical protein